MRRVEPNVRALAKLLKIARMRTDAASRRIADLRSELQEAEASLSMLEGAVADEEAAVRTEEVVGFLQLAGFLAGARQKRAALLETKAKIVAEIATAELDLADALLEAKKLDHLIACMRRATVAARRKAETAAIESAALQGFARAGRR